MKQIINELKAQPVIAWVTILGTALAMFLIMIVVMLDQVKVVSMAPESDRDLYLYATRGQAWSTDTANQMSAQSAIGEPMVDKIFRPLTTPKMMSVFNKYVEEASVSAPGVPAFTCDMRATDANFFRLYDFKFLAGMPYDSAAVISHFKKAVITKGIAEETFKSVNGAVGKDIFINDVPYTVTGVVDNVSPVTSKAYAQVWTPLPYEEPDEWSIQWGLGSYAVVMLASDKKNLAEIKREVKTNLAKYNAEKAAEMIENDLGGGPYTHIESAYGQDFKLPDMAKERRSQYLLYVILLLIPAINLSTMTRSRLAYRTSEIGVRRAFGAPRSSIVFGIITENLIITLIGGVLGLILSWIFGGMFFDSIYSAGWFTTYNTAVTPGAEALFAWSTFFYVLAFCFILNLISSGIPAIRASRINPVDAISAKTK